MRGGLGSGSLGVRRSGRGLGLGLGSGGWSGVGLGWGGLRRGRSLLRFGVRALRAVCLLLLLAHVNCEED